MIAKSVPHVWHTETYKQDVYVYLNLIEYFAYNLSLVYVYNL